MTDSTLFSKINYLSNSKLRPTFLIGFGDFEGDIILLHISIS
jgi:hypothetical protein